MSDPTPPAVSDAMREAVASLPEATYDDLARACRQTELENRRLTSEIARLTGERDAAHEDSAKFFAASVRAGERIAAAEAETARLRAALEDLGEVANDLAQLSIKEGDNKAAGALQYVSGFISDRLAALTSQGQADV